MVILSAIRPPERALTRTQLKPGRSAVSHGSHLGHNILLFVERLSSCVTGAKNTTPPLLPPSLPACSAHIVFTVWSAGGEGRGGGGRHSNPGYSTDFSGQEWCHCDVNACNCNRAAKLPGDHSDSERAERGKGRRREQEGVKAEGWGCCCCCCFFVLRCFLLPGCWIIGNTRWL